MVRSTVVGGVVIVLDCEKNSNNFTLSINDQIHIYDRNLCDPEKIYNQKVNFYSKKIQEKKI